MTAIQRASRFAGDLARKLGLWSTERPLSEPRTFPSQGFDIIDESKTIEEEDIPGYKPEYFYPVELGEVIDERFQTVTKLGYGSCSTIWLARDLQDHRYLTLKFYVHNCPHQRELPFYERLRKLLPSQHPGAGRIRHLLGHLEIKGPDGTHSVLIHDVSQMSLRDMNAVFERSRGFNEEAVRFKVLEDEEMAKPSCRKKFPDRTIYCSRLLTPADGPLLLSDFGEARLGPGPHAGDIMPVLHRAPEVIMWIQWSYPVDIWSVGLTAWDLLEGRPLFSAKKEDGSISDGAQLSELIAALGPPPKKFLKRNPKRTALYWDEDGNWTDFVPIPWERTLEARETKLQDKKKFLQFMRRALAWDPSDRPTARDLLADPWLQGGKDG
ncbi:hypothetical protein E4U41_007583 [Claviceps citrina]|nr:hypothetical protein E4U41_007583 [Claviceps citrina]